jgi:putative membrane protein
MFAGILEGALVGVILGTVTGLIPGIHSNTVAGALIGLQSLLLPIFGTEVLAASMLATLITHTFLDTIPSTFLGVPEADTAFSTLPAHALALEGNGEEAVRIAALGCAYGVITAVPVAIIFLWILPPLQPILDWGIGLLLVAVFGYLLVTDNAPGWAAIVFALSGALGVFALHYSYLGPPDPGGGAILMPLLSGLFGISLLIRTAEGPVPLQVFRGIRLDGTRIRRGALLGTAAGAIVGWLPGLSNATANALLGSVTGTGRDRRGYILATGAAGAANAIVGLAVLSALSRERSGVMAAISELGAPDFLSLLGVAAISATAAYAITILIARRADLISGLDQRRLSRIVIAFLAVICGLITGIFGLIVLALATLCGLIPELVNIPRLHCMGAIVVPVLLFTLGIRV